MENTSNCVEGSGNGRKSSTGREEEARLRAQVRNAGNGRSDRRLSGKKRAGEDEKREELLRTQGGAERETTDQRTTPPTNQPWVDKE